MARFIAQIILTGVQVVGRAFAKAVRQEMAASQEAAKRLGNTKSRSERLNNLKTGLTLEEAMKILNVDKLNKEEIESNYDKYFKNNDKQKGGTLYIQSKFVQAKERLDQELQHEHEDSNKSSKAKT